MRIRLPLLALTTAAALSASGAGSAAQAQISIGPISGPIPPVRLRPAPQARTLDGSAHVGDAARSVAHDSAGNVIAAGFLYGATTGRDFVVTKHSTGGGLLWSRSFQLPGHDEATAVAVDSRDNIWAAGYAPVGPGNTNTLAWVMQYSPTGVWLSSSTLAGTVPGPCQANDIAIDAGDNVVVCGYLANAVPAGSPLSHNLDAFVWRIPVGGGPGSFRTLAGTSAAGPDVARAVAVDGAGNIAIAGSQTNAAGNRDFLLARYDSGLNLLWRDTGDGSAQQDDEWIDVAIDSQGDIGVAGRIADRPGDTTFTYAHYRADNRGMARLSLDAVSPLLEEARSVTFDPSDRMVITGAAVDASGAQSLVTVRQPWTSGFRRIAWLPNVAGGWEVGNSVRTDRNGNISVAGARQGTTAGSNFILLKLAESNMAVTWLFERNGSAAGSVDEARSVSVDADGWAAAAGTLQNASTGPDYTVAF